MKTVLITGASRGIGKEIAELFAKDNCRLLLIAIEDAELIAVQNDLQTRYQIQVEILSIDLSQPGSLEIITKRFAADLPKVDVLINNAGFGITKNFEAMSLTEIRSLIQVNITVVTELAYLVLPHMIAKKSGSILNVASVAAFCPGPYMSVYYATKAYVHSFSTSLREEYKKIGINISTLCPGITNTAFMTQSGLAKTSLGDHFFIKMLNPDEVAKCAYEGFNKKKRLIIPGIIHKLSVFCMCALPGSIMGKIISYLEKPALPR